jgi:hypothetical protein
MIRRVRSSRQVEYHVEHSIDFMWLTSGRKIDHSTLSNFRRQHKEELKDLYRQVVQLAVQLGVAKLSEVCIDGTRILANASRFKTLKAEKVKALLDDLDRQIAEAMKEIEANDSYDELFDTEDDRADKLPSSLRDMQERQKRLKEALETLNAMEAQRKKDGINPQKNPAQLPTTDTDSRILPNKEGGYAPNYTPMAVTETESGFIVGADVLVGNVEHTVLIPMVNEVEADYGVQVSTVLADGVYSTGPNLQSAEARGLEILSPLANDKLGESAAQRSDLTQPVAPEQIDKLPISPQTKCIDKSAFIYDEANDLYYCPMGKTLTPEGTEKSERNGTVTRETRYRCHECKGCPLGSKCRTNPDSKGGRRISRDEFEKVRRQHSERMSDEKNKARYKRRQHIAETAFAMLKAALDLRRFLLRGHEGVKQEWLWACTGFNLKKLMKMWETLRPQLSQ